MTDKQIASIILDMQIIVDTREQKNDHIIEYFKYRDIPYVVEKLETADYSFMLPHYAKLGLDQKFLVEKKNSLDEIAGNFTKDRDRFEREFFRAHDQKIHLVIETATWKRLLNHNYRSKFEPSSFTASLMTWGIRYNCPIWFVGKEESPYLIYNILKYELMEHLKQNP